jgi:dolichol-phosphate mannosyltransferase
MQRLSVVIPAHNEEGSIGATLSDVAERLDAEGIAFEIVVVDDHSTDGTPVIVAELARRWPTIRCVSNLRPLGFGNAIHSGLDCADGDGVCIVMGDGSDDPRDIVAYWRTLAQGYDCVFGSRFMQGAEVVDYPKLKLFLNRLANSLIAAAFGVRYNDMTNAFKCFRRETINGIRPILSHHFNITVELPLKAIVRGYTWTVIPTNWYNRKDGVSKFKVKEMGSRYLFIVLYALIEKWLSRGDYRRHASRRTESWSPAPSEPVGPN